MSSSRAKDPYDRKDIPNLLFSCFADYLLSRYSPFNSWTNEKELNKLCGQWDAANMSGKVALLSKTILEPSLQLRFS